MKRQPWPLTCDKCDRDFGKVYGNRPPDSGTGGVHKCETTGRTRRFFYRGEK